MAVCLCTKQEIHGWVDAEVEGRIIYRKDQCHEREGYNKEQEEKCVRAGKTEERYMKLEEEESFGNSRQAILKHKVGPTLQDKDREGPFRTPARDFMKSCLSLSPPLPGHE